MSVPVLRRPRRLEPGDRVALVSPSGPVEKDRLDFGCGLLREWGLDVVLMPHVTGSDERLRYLAAPDTDRAADMQEAWCDPSVAAVMCSTGGYGAQRILELVDWDAMRAAGPKVFAGFSDITALHEAFAHHLGLATLYAPMVANGSLGFPAAAEHLRQTLFEPESVQVLTSDTARTLVPGRAAGVTFGGCLSPLVADLGTPTERSDVAGGILLLEATGAKAYRIDQCLTQLLRAGWFDSVAGIAFGSWEGCDPAEAIVRDRLAAFEVPVIWELGFGHCDPTLTIPLGLPATINADDATLELDVPALV